MKSLLTSIAGVAAALAFTCSAAAPGSDQDQVHHRLEDPGRPCLVLSRQGEWIFPRRGARRHDRSGGGFRRRDRARAIGRLRCGIRRYQCRDPERRRSPWRAARDGVPGLQPRALCADREGQRADQDPQGRRGTYHQRAGRLGDAADVHAAGENRRHRPVQGENPQCGAEPDRATAGSRAGRRHRPVLGDELHEFHRHAPRSRHAIFAGSSTATTGSISIPTGSWCRRSS